MIRILKQQLAIQVMFCKYSLKGSGKLYLEIKSFWYSTSKTQDIKWFVKSNGKIKLKIVVDKRKEKKQNDKDGPNINNLLIDFINK